MSKNIITSKFDKNISGNSMGNNLVFMPKASPLQAGIIKPDGSCFEFSQTSIFTLAQSVKDKIDKVPYIDNRLSAVESKNTQQDGRLQTIESKNTEQDGRLDNVESDINNATNGIKKRLNTLETDINNATNGIKKRLTDVESENSTQDGRLNTLETDINNTTSGIKKRLTDVEGKNSTQDGRLQTIENTLPDKIPYENSDRNSINLEKATFNEVYVTGKMYQTDITVLEVADNIITLRDGVSASIPDGQLSGFVIKKYNGLNDAYIAIDKNGFVMVGDEGDLQRVATIWENSQDGDVLIFDKDAETIKSISKENFLADVAASFNALALSVSAVESKNTQQDGRLQTIESKNTEQDGRLDNVESKNTEQDGRLDSVESENTTQNTNISNLQTAVGAIAPLESRVTTLEGQVLPPVRFTGQFTILTSDWIQDSLNNLWYAGVELAGILTNDLIFVEGATFADLQYTNLMHCEWEDETKQLLFKITTAPSVDVCIKWCAIRGE